ncbi:MAG TPA: phosphodiester glycosidase family protein [Actinomycetes bacterium]|nr:phosphodiester glycosidase family protein [Actinomycetes bacterium]
MQSAERETPLLDEEVPTEQRRPRRRLRRNLRLVRTLLLIAVIVIGWSVAHALLAPGTDSASVRLAEWARNHSLGFAVTGLEEAQYKMHPPKVGGTPDLSLLQGSEITSPPSGSPVSRSSATGRSRATSVASVSIQATLASIATPALKGEGVYRAAAYAHGQPIVQVAYLRPDSQHTSYLAGVMWMDGAQVRFVQHPGYADPGNLNLWKQPDTIPPSARKGLVATFNSGFKLKDARGGYYADGHTMGKLTPGAASLVIYRDGHAAIGAWGSEVSMNSSVVSVRQNLRLLIDNGKVAGNVAKDVQSNWGATLKGSYYVWRSGLGVTSAGDFVFVAGNALSVQSLANLLQHAGAVRAMQLDINPAWISGMWYTPGPGGATPHKLVDFKRPVNRYFTDTSRDFIAVYGR